MVRIKLLSRILSALLLTVPAVSAQGRGITPEWDFQKTVQQLITDTNRLRPTIDQIKPQEWVAKGAPQAYVGQYNSTRTQLDGVIWSAGQLSKEPEKLTAALDTLFRLQTLELMLSSLSEGVRRYQNPELADLLNGIRSEHSASRERLQQYVVDLAATKEQEFAVIDKEAQRCRGALVRPPGPPAAKPPERK